MILIGSALIFQPTERQRAPHFETKARRAVNESHFTVPLCVYFFAKRVTQIYMRYGLIPFGPASGGDGRHGLTNSGRQIGMPCTHGTTPHQHRTRRALGQQKYIGTRARRKGFHFEFKLFILISFDRRRMDDECTHANTAPLTRDDTDTELSRCVYAM